MKIFNRIFASFLLLVLLALFVFWAFYYRDAMKNARERALARVQSNVIELERALGQYFSLKRSELDVLSEIESLKIFLKERDFLKVKTRRQAELSIIDFVGRQEDVAAVRIIESAFYTKEPTALEVERDRSKFILSGFSETLKIERDKSLKERFDPVYNYDPVDDKAFLNGLFEQGYSYARKTSDGVEYISIGKAIKHEITDELMGIIVFDIPESYLQKYFQDNGRIYIKDFSVSTDAGDKLFWSEAVVSVGSGHTLEDPSDLDLGMLEKYPLVTMNAPLKGVGLNLAADIDSQSVRAEWQTTRRFLAVFFLSFSVVALFVSYLLSKSIATPIKDLNDAVSAFDSAGPKRISEKYNVSEIEHLKDTFNEFVERLGKYKREIETNAHLAAIGKTTAMIAHDIRSPLVVLSGYFKKGVNQGAIQGADDRYFDAAKNSVDKLNRLADDLAHYSAARQISRSETDITKIVKEAINEAEIGTVSKTPVFSYKGPDSIMAEVDGFKLSRVMQNLISNAVKATDISEMPRIEIRVLARDDVNLVIEVSDNGCGIPKENTAKIFDTFFSRSGKKGCGLGLSYCKQVVESHGGRIELLSPVGGGSIFLVTIPDCIKTKAAKDEINVRKGETANMIGLGGLILVVDDENHVLDEWCRLLKDAGLNAVTARNGKDVLAFDFEKNRVEGAIVDYKYDGSYITGLEIIEFLKTKGIGNIHLCTGFFNDLEIADKASALGVVSIIPKPLPKTAEGLFNTEGSSL